MIRQTVDEAVIIFILCLYISGFITQNEGLFQKIYFLTLLGALNLEEISTRPPQPGTQRPKPQKVLHPIGIC